MQGVFNPNILIYHPPNSAEGLHFSAFHYFMTDDTDIIILLMADDDIDSEMI